MEKVLYMLIFSLAFNSCNKGSYTESCIPLNNTEEINVLIDYQVDTKHLITDKGCHIINEWLNRKSMGRFLKNHISLESTILGFNKKTHLNDTFIS